MSDYIPPVDEMMFVLENVTGFGGLSALDGIAPSDIRLVLESAGKLASEVLAPLNHPGDEEGNHFENGTVKTVKGFRDAYRQYRENGWNGVPFDPDYGGQGLPWMVAFAIQEMWQSANMSFGLCPMLNQAAVEAIASHGTDEQKKTYLAKLISGEWTGTMHLTEPHAGTDLGALKTKAVKQTDGAYKLSGQKIFITYGEHDLAENIIHMVLARVAGAPEGTKGISMFVVPKFIPDANGQPGKRNDVKCVSIEHKLGIHASPTCTMQFGDEGGATGWLIGKENEGLKYMFTMMNNARLSVGLQGVALAERAYQHALAYAKDRVQGTRLTDKTGARVAIIEHPDIRRMLLSMKSRIVAARMLAYDAAKMMDLSHAGNENAKARAALLTPVVKAWCTDIAVDVASLGIQIHGGMGFIEETGAAQYYRDARILPIYEGANGIQALDLSLRKVCGDKGQAAHDYFAAIEKSTAALQSVAALAPFRAALEKSLKELRNATSWTLDTAAGEKFDDIAAVSVPYLRLFGNVAAAHMLARAAEKSEAHRSLALFFGTHILPACGGLRETVMNGSVSVVGAASL
jgi:alkylation response protein AidB-like acyl-CoA dehydrogenase